MDYKLSTEEKKIYVCEAVSDNKKNIRRYEFNKTEHGWMVKAYNYNVEHAWPKENSMWLPDEVVDLITSMNAKEKLSE